MSHIKVLVVDDDEMMRSVLASGLERCGFVVTTAANMADALKRIRGPYTYDVLVSDLHMPGAGDGLTVMSAMRQLNPSAVAWPLSAFPQITAAAEAIHRQADDILVKPTDLLSLIELIHQRMAIGPQYQLQIETLASILDRTTSQIIERWLKRVHEDDALMAICLSDEQRCGYLPLLLRDMVAHLDREKLLNSDGLSSSAAEHGVSRFSHGYTTEMLVKEYRILQASIFDAMQNKLGKIGHGIISTDVIAVADEIDFQLNQSIAGYTKEMQLAA